MTKKRVLPVRRYETATFPVQDTLLKTPSLCMPTNVAEEKEKFLKSGKTPKFHLKDRSKVDELASKTKNHIRFDLLGEAQYILETVRERYGNGEFYLEHAFGTRITKEEATPIVLQYIAEHNLPESLKIHWCDNLPCSAKMVWTGPMVNSNRPELRKYSLWLSGSDENPYIRESGIRCLMDHEIGTHFFRSFNDGLQPWFADRERFGLRKLGAFEVQCTEEGLAAIHTVLRGRVRFLWGAAMAYYIACKAAEMTFKELFDHLGRYTSNPDYRWKQAMRVKRGLEDPNDLGGFGNDQCYFEGAVNILRRIDDIDFQLLMMGKVCYDELGRIKRVVRKDVVQFPNFMKNMAAYKKSLRKVLVLNGLDGFHLKQGPPDAYLKHLEEKKQGKGNQKSKKVRPNAKLSMLSRTVGHKGKNKKTSKTEKIEGEDEEVKSFNCSQPFINMHSRKKPEEACKKMFRGVTDEMKIVKKLTDNIFEKDVSLVKQIERLQSIVNSHEWTVLDDPYIDGLKEEAMIQNNCTNPYKDCSWEGAFPALIDKDLCSSNCNTKGDMSSSECVDLGTSDLNNNNNMILESCSHSLCTNSSTDTDSQQSAKNVERVCVSAKDQGNDITDTLNGENESNETPAKRNACHKASTGNLLHQRKKETNTISNRGGRKLLHTPVADLSGYDSIVASIEHNKSVIETSGIEKRISLKNSNTSETKLHYREGTEKLIFSPSVLVNNQLQWVEKTRKQYETPGINSKTDDQILQCEMISNQNSSNPSSSQNLDEYQSTSDSNDRSSYISHRKKTIKYRPLSTGSERIIKFHWMNFSSNFKMDKKHSPPLKSRHNSISRFNNNFAAFKEISSSTDSSFQNAFPMMVHTNQGPALKRN